MKTSTLHKTIHFFKSALVNQGSVKNIATLKEEYIRGLKSGIELSKDLIDNVQSTIELKRIVDEAIEQYGVNPKEVVSTFYKSFESVEKSTEEELRINQLIHYMTTYGGLAEMFDIPIFEPEEFVYDDQKIHSKFVKIDFITKDQLNTKVKTLLQSGLALREDDVKMLVELIQDENLQIDINEIKNKEAQAIFAVTMNIYPKDVSAFLRVLIYKKTGSLLVIKNEEMFHSLRNMSNSSFDENIFATKLKNIGFDVEPSEFDSYIKEYGIIPLAENFNRYRKIFVALKDTKNKTIINKIARLSKKYHKSSETLNISNILNASASVSDEDIKKILKEANIYNLIKVYNAMIYKENAMNTETIEVYRVRNGKTFIKDGVKVNDIENIKVHRFVREEMNRRFDHLKSKVFIVPDNVNYVIPTSQKTMIGSIPDGTMIKLGNRQNEVVGISWDWHGDLDLSCTDVEGNHVGWNSYHKNSIFTFSGDMTDLNQHGFASEQIKINLSSREMKPLLINSYLYSFRGNDNEGRFTVYAGQAGDKSPQTANSLMDVASLDFSTKLDVHEFGSHSLGMIIKIDNEWNLVMTTRKIPGSGMIANPNANKKILEGITKRYQSALTFKNIVTMGGGITISQRELDELKEKYKDSDEKPFILQLDENQFIDMSPENLQNDTFINLLVEE